MNNKNEKFWSQERISSHFNQEQIYKNLDELKHANLDELKHNMDMPVGARTDMNYFTNTDSTNQTDSQLETVEKKLISSKAILSNMQQDLKWLINNRKSKSEIDKLTIAIDKLKDEIRDLEEQKKKLETLDEKIDDPWQKLGV